MNDTIGAGAAFRTGHFRLDGTVDHSVTGYTDGSLWNGWATPVFDRDTATMIMRAVDEANRRLGLDEEDEDAELVSYDPDQDAFLVGHADGPIAFPGYDVDVDGERIHVDPPSCFAPAVGFAHRPLSFLLKRARRTARRVTKRHRPEPASATRRAASAAGAASNRSRRVLPSVLLVPLRAVPVRRVGSPRSIDSSP
jgi:hypothetical protein